MYLIKAVQEKQFNSVKLRGRCICCQVLQQKLYISSAQSFHMFHMIVTFNSYYFPHT